MTRRLLHQVIVADPGRSYRELMVSTGYADGTIRHHLKCLQRTGLVVGNRGADGTIRYFENHGRYDTDWKRVAALKDSRLRRLHAWITAHPDEPVRAIVSAFREWPRSTTYDRIKKLEEWGLVRAHHVGNARRYHAT